jgi:hypothetical protein
MQRLAMLREMKSYHTMIAKSIGGLVMALEKEIHEDFTEAQIEEMKIAASYIHPETNEKIIIFKDGRARKLTKDEDLQITVVDQDGLFKWLRANNAGTLIKENISGAALKSHIEALGEENKPKPNETILKIWEQPKIKVTKV